MAKVLDWVRGHAIASVVIAFLLGVGAGNAGTATTPTTDDGDTTPATASDNVDGEEGQQDAAPAPEPEPEPEAEPEFVRPTKEDFRLKIKTLRNECFGSAGCNTEIRVGLVYLGSGKLDPSKTYELTYKILGADDALLSTIQVTGRNYTVDEHFIGTPPDAQLKAVITRVSQF